VKKRDSQPRCYKCLEIGHIAAAGAVSSAVTRCTKSLNVPTRAYAFYAPKEERSRGATKQKAGGVLTPQKKPQPNTANGSGPDKPESLPGCAGPTPAVSEGM